MMESNTKASNKCSKPHCRNDAASRRAKFCTDCFRTNASCANSKRKVFGGNTTTARGKGVLGNKGNTRAKGVLGNKGNTANNKGNMTTGPKKRLAGKKGGKTTGPKKRQAGKKGGKTTGPKKRQAGKKGGERSALRRSAKMKAKASNKCITPRCRNDAASRRAKFCTDCFTTGQKKRQAGKKGGKRSALRRSTKMLLIVKNPWLDLILSKEKTWEIRDAQTKQRGKIHLALSGAGGRIVGQCHITDSVAIDRLTLRTTFARHRIKDLARITYRRPHAWVLSKARRYMKPFVYSHPQGAIKWVRL